jgi:hypothetical protein
MEHNPVHHPEGGVWEHVLLCVEASESYDPVTNLAILFHDIGKGVTRTYGDDGMVHYYGHEAAGLPVFAAITERLGFTNEERRAIEFAMEMHMVGHKLDQFSGRKLLPLRSHPDWLTLFHVVKADEKVRMHLWNEPSFLARMQRWMKSSSRRRPSMRVKRSSPHSSMDATSWNCARTLRARKLAKSRMPSARRFWPGTIK